MRRHIFDQIKRIVKDQSTRVGEVVSNLHGVVDTAEVRQTRSLPKAWYAVALPTNRFPTLPEFVDLYAHEMSGLTEVDAVDSVAVFPAGSPLPAKQTALLLSSIKVNSTREVPIEVESRGSEITVYIGGARIAGGRDKVRLSPSLSGGTHRISVLARNPRAAFTVSVESAPDVEFVREVGEAAAPSISEINVFYLGSGSYVTRVEWPNDSYASSWGVYRADCDDLGEISNTRYNTDGTVTFELVGNWDVRPGEEFFTEYFHGGLVQSVEVVTPVTRVTAIPSAESPLDDAAAWDGRHYFQRGQFFSLGTVTYAGGRNIRYDDRNVVPKRVYVYKLTAFGLLSGLTESDYSEPQWVYTNDEEPPRGVNADPNNPPIARVMGDQVTVDYLAPNDPDFAGVRVYGPYPLDTAGGVEPPMAFTPVDRVVSKPGEPGAWDQVSFRVDEGTLDSAFFLATFDHMGNEQAPIEVVNERTGEAYPPAWAYVYDGPVEAEQLPTNCAIDLNVATDPEDPEHMIHTANLRIFPQGATVNAYLNDLALDESTDPSLDFVGTGSDGQHPYDEYQVAITRSEAVDQRFVVRASAPGYLPAVVTYSLDRDDIPGVSGVHVENRTRRPVVRAVMDDDSRWLRLVREDDQAVLFTATRDEGADSGSVQRGVTVMEYTHGAELAPEAVVQVRIDASKNGTTWVTGVWRGSLQGPVDVPDGLKPPLIQVEQFNVTKVSPYGVYADFSITATAENRNGGQIRLLWQAQEDNLAWETITSIGDSYGVVTSPIEESTVSRVFQFTRAMTRMGDRVIRLRAETLDPVPLAAETIYVADWDTVPEVVTATAIPYPRGGTQTGWQIIGSVDDDTDEVEFDLEDVAGAETGSHGIVMPDPPPITDTSSIKTFDFVVSQAAGRIGNLVITPKRGHGENQFDGAPYRVPLQRRPVSTLRIEDIDATTVQAIMTSTPQDARKMIRSYLINPDGSPVSTVPNFRDYEPSLRYKRDPHLDRIVEYYSEANGLVEEVNTMVVDIDDIADLDPWDVVVNGNNIIVNVTPDDDCVRWKCWARKGADPAYDDDYLRFEGSPNTNSITFYATAKADGSDADWYISVGAVSWSGETNNYDAVVRQVVGSGTGGGPGEPPPTDEAPVLLNFTIFPDRIGGRHVLSWKTNAAGAGQTVVVEGSNSSGHQYVFEGVTGEDVVSGTAEGQLDHPGIPFDRDGHWQQYTYKIYFKDYPQAGSITKRYADYYESPL